MHKIRNRDGKTVMGTENIKRNIQHIRSVLHDWIHEVEWNKYFIEK